MDDGLSGLTRYSAYYDAPTGMLRLAAWLPIPGVMHAILISHPGLLPGKRS